MNLAPVVFIDELHLRLSADIQQFAKLRQADVARGAETPELAGLIVEKYCTGLARTAVRAAEILDLAAPDLTPLIDHVVAEIDPDAAQHRERRWAARPARLVVADTDETATAEVTSNSQANAR